MHESDRGASRQNKKPRRKKGVTKKHEIVHCRNISCTRRQARMGEWEREPEREGENERGGGIGRLGWEGDKKEVGT